MNTTTRAERRREKHAASKAGQYAKSKFKDRAVYVPFSLPERTGSRHNGGYTAAELHQRAVVRRDHKRMVDKSVLKQIEASKEADKDRRRDAKLARREVYLAGCAKPQPVRHMHSAARHRHASLAPALTA